MAAPTPSTPPTHALKRWAALIIGALLLAEIVNVWFAAGKKPQNTARAQPANSSRSDNSKGHAKEDTSLSIAPPPETSRAPAFSMADTNSIQSEPIALGKPDPKGELSSEGVPAIHLPVTVCLDTCRRINGKYRWYFRVVNKSDTAWEGKITIAMAAGSEEVISQDFVVSPAVEPERTVGPGFGTSLHYIETTEPPKSLGGSITEYHYALESGTGSL